MPCHTTQHNTTSRYRVWGRRRAALGRLSGSPCAVGGLSPPQRAAPAAGLLWLQSDCPQSQSRCLTKPPSCAAAQEPHDREAGRPHTPATPPARALPDTRWHAYCHATFCHPGGALSSSTRLDPATPTNFFHSSGKRTAGPLAPTRHAFRSLLPRTRCTTGASRRSSDLLAGWVGGGTRQSLCKRAVGIVRMCSRFSRARAPAQPQTDPPVAQHSWRACCLVATSRLLYRLSFRRAAGGIRAGHAAARGQGCGARRPGPPPPPPPPPREHAAQNSPPPAMGGKGDAVSASAGPAEDEHMGGGGEDGHGGGARLGIR
jgi:hypothetical protein